MRRLSALTIGIFFAALVSPQVASVPISINSARRLLSLHTFSGLSSESSRLAKAQGDVSASRQATTMTAFNQALVDADHRTLNTTVSFPKADRSYGKVTMKLKLDCPNENCDYWDRSGYVAIVGSDNKKIELMRLMTPYGLAGEWSLDVTSLQPLLQGDVQLELFIDTWVKSGDGNNQGDGWLATVSFEFEGDSPAEQPVQVIPLWNEQELVVGDPRKPIEGKISPINVTIPENASRVELRSLITGHGQGNTVYRNPAIPELEQNYHESGCAEWCSLEHTYLIGESKFSRVVWRDNCDITVGPDRFGGQEQGGNWSPHRAGWCPGDIVEPWVEDVSDAVSEAAEADIPIPVNYAIENYINKLSSGYDGNQHTEPFYRTSAVLVIYAR